VKDLFHDDDRFGYCGAVQIDSGLVGRRQPKRKSVRKKGGIRENDCHLLASIIVRAAFNASVFASSWNSLA
jgi:hypothetical protein